MSLILLIYCDPPTPVDPASGYLSWRSHPVHCQTNPSDRGHTPLLVPLASHQTPFASFLRSGRKTESVHIHRVIMGFPGGSLPLIQHPSPWASCAAMRGCGLPGPPRAHPLGASPLGTIAGSKWINSFSYPRHQVPWPQHQLHPRM